MRWLWLILMASSCTPAIKPIECREAGISLESPVIADDHTLTVLNEGEEDIEIQAMFDPILWTVDDETGLWYAILFAEHTRVVGDGGRRPATFTAPGCSTITLPLEYTAVPPAFDSIPSPMTTTLHLVVDEDEIVVDVGVY